jgi:tetratricopeptide (TPR) repeat protein
LSDHPSRKELSALVRGRLAAARHQAIVRHLLQPCTACLTTAPYPVRVLLGFESGPVKSPPENEADYESNIEAALDRASKPALRHDRYLRGQEAQAEKAAKILLRGGVEAAEKLPLRMGNLARLKALLAASWSLRHEDPGQMVRWAFLAVKCAERLDARRFGIERVFDFKSRAQAELGNAYRVTDQLDMAQAALDRARQLFELGTRSEVLEIHLLELEASLDSDFRRFKAASLKLEKVYRYYRRHLDEHLAGRALLKQGLYRGYAGSPEEALRLLGESLSLIDAEREPSLAYAGMHNQITFLVDCDQFREAEKQLFLLRPLQQYTGGLINQIRLRWEQARIDAGLERFERAEKGFREVRDGFTPIHRAYDSALASLDLAAVLLAQRKSDEAKEVAREAGKIFVALRIEREALGSIIVLRTSFELGIVTRAMVEEVARFLRKAENDPNAKFEANAWGGREP